MVYIDDMEAEVRRGAYYMKLCHMIADTHDELVEMADKVGLPRKWIQKEGTAEEHFDITKSMKRVAIRLGAKDITQRDSVRIIQRKRDNQPVEKKP